MDIAGNGRMLARVGYLNKPRSAGIQHAKSLIVVRKEKEPEKAWNDRDHISEMSVSTAIQESFMRVVKPDQKGCLNLQRDLVLEQTTQTHSNGAAYAVQE